VVVRLSSTPIPTQIVTMYSEEKLDEIIAEYAITSNPLKQKIYIALG
ncbi:uncharacterized protein METZ01_LOCUS485791, partial [marine metagenome]